MKIQPSLVAAVAASHELRAALLKEPIETVLLLVIGDEQRGYLLGAAGVAASSRNESLGIGAWDLADRANDFAAFMRGVNAAEANQRLHGILAGWVHPTLGAVRGLALPADVEAFVLHVCDLADVANIVDPLFASGAARYVAPPFEE